MGLCNGITRCHTNIVSHFPYPSVQFQKRLCKSPVIFILYQEVFIIIRLMKIIHGAVHAWGHNFYTDMQNGLKLKIWHEKIMIHALELKYFPYVCAGKPCICNVFSHSVYYLDIWSTIFAWTGYYWFHRPILCSSYLRAAFIDIPERGAPTRSILHYRSNPMITMARLGDQFLWSQLVTRSVPIQSNLIFRSTLYINFRSTLYIVTNN